MTFTLYGPRFRPAALFSASPSATSHCLDSMRSQLRAEVLDGRVPKLHVLFPPPACAHVGGVGESFQFRDVVAGECHGAGSCQAIDVAGLGDADDRRCTLGDGPSRRDIGDRRLPAPGRSRRASPPAPSIETECHCKLLPGHCLSAADFRGCTCRSRCPVQAPYRRRMECLR